MQSNLLEFDPHILDERTVNEAANGQNINLKEFHCQNGVVLKIQKVKQSIVREIVSKLVEPKVPVVYIEDKDRSEENPADPGYLDALSKYQLAASLSGIAAYLLFGTSLISRPSEVPDVDDDWHTQFEEFDIQIRDKGKRTRYLDWLKYIVLEDDDEIVECVQAIKRLSGGVSEDDVTNVTATFPDTQERSTDQ